MPDTTLDTEFVRHLSFSKPWRPYQQRAIDNFARHTADRHFHLVAAPGSGKTVMGVESVRRLKRPALILAPTLAIREQWVKRLINDFLPPGFSEIVWLSRDIKAPRELTLTTYQALGSEFRRDGGVDVLRQLRELGVSVIVVDEAHHLRAFWWKCLKTLKESLDQPYVIALTATPPVDVPQAEWNRYAGFCGNVDEEVGVPELVAEGNLCPHQDYVHFSLPTGVEAERLRDFHQRVKTLVLDLQLDTGFATQLAAIPHWLPEKPGRDFLRSQQDFYLALSIYLTKTAGYLPTAIRRHYPVTDIELPELDAVWVQALMQGLLFDFRKLIEGICDPALQANLKKWTARVRNLGGIEKGRVVLLNSRDNTKTLRSSPAKIDAVAEIISHESSAMGLSLRAVVLTDYIRREAFPAGLTDATDTPLEKIGVVPLFERLRRMQLPDISPGILTGSLVVVPVFALDQLQQILQKMGASAKNFSSASLRHAPDFAEVSVREADRQKVVEAVTQLFSSGEINCLIGTSSLLGEGWDAPTLNTLVLASVVGSFVMSNQMRGRAIRINPLNPDKAANIWHLATLNPGWVDDSSGDIAGGDFSTLKRRFDAFHGVAYGCDEDGHARIENGLARLDCDQPPAPEIDAIEGRNRQTLRLAEDRFAMQEVWKKAIAPRLEGRFLRPVRTLSTPTALVRSRFTAWLGDSEKGLRASACRWLQVRLLRNIAAAIVDEMAELVDIDPDFSSRQLRVTVSGKSIRVSLPGAGEEIQACLVRSLAEYYDLFDNPRYLLRAKVGWFAVPEIFGVRKKRAQAFSRRLKSAIGRHQLIFAHGSSGIAHLLEARQQGLLRHNQLRTSACVRWEPECDE